MATLITLDAVAHTREQLGTPGAEIWRTFFFPAPPGTRLPQAFRVEYAPGRVLRTHFHDVDEFQVVVAGSGRLGTHALVPGTVHFARAHTGYGPIVAGPEGLSFLTLRARRDAAGPQLLPEKREELLRVPEREPWQASCVARFADVSDRPGAVAIHSLQPLHDERGLDAFVVCASPFARTGLPPALGSGGQFVAILKGSAVAGDTEYVATTVGFVSADEPALEVTAGAFGLNALVFNFPKQRTASAAP